MKIEPTLEMFLLCGEYVKNDVALIRHTSALKMVLIHQTKGIY